MYYEHIFERVKNVNGTTVMWDLPVVTGRKILAKRPVIALHDEKEETCRLIDIAIADDSNFNTKESEKLSKYKDLEVEVNRMWKMRTEIVPVITGALGAFTMGCHTNEH